MPLSTPDNSSNNIIRLSVSEASRFFGIDQKTIRRAIKNQELRYVVVRNRYKINFESLLKWSQQKTTVKNKLASRGIGQYVDAWKIKNKLYSPNPASLDKPKEWHRLTVSPITAPPMAIGGQSDYKIIKGRFETCPL